MRSTPARIESSSVTSMVSSRTPSSASSFIRSSRRAAPYTVYPTSRSLSAVASPIPDEAPVTRAVLDVMSVLLSAELRFTGYAER